MAAGAGFLAAGLALIAQFSDHDPIHAAVARIRAHPLWANGIYRAVALPGNATDSQILAKARSTVSFPGKTPNYVILEEETVQIPYPARAVLVMGGAQQEIWILEFASHAWTVHLESAGAPGK
jgi:hypothetical protein